MKKISNAIPVHISLFFKPGGLSGFFTSGSIAMIGFKASNNMYTQKRKTAIFQAVNKPKYIRLDGKPLPRIYHDPEEFNIENGFHELVQGKNVCLVSTGYMTHKALNVANKLCENNINIGVIDVFLLKPLNEDLIYNLLQKYENIITLEEAFINKGGLDSMISCVLSNRASHIKLKRLGFGDKYVFDIGSRDYFHKLNNMPFP